MTKKEKTFWNGEPCQAKIVRVIVGKAPRPTWWCAPYEGQEREAVRIDYDGQTFYIDNEGGWGWDKVKTGGSPLVGHKSLPVARELP